MKRVGRFVRREGLFILFTVDHGHRHGTAFGELPGIEIQRAADEAEGFRRHERRAEARQRGQHGVARLGRVPALADGVQHAAEVVEVRGLHRLGRALELPGDLFGDERAHGLGRQADEQRRVGARRREQAQERALAVADEQELPALRLRQRAGRLNRGLDVAHLGIQRDVELRILRADEALVVAQRAHALRREPRREVAPTVTRERQQRVRPVAVGRP